MILTLTLWNRAVTEEMLEFKSCAKAGAPRNVAGKMEKNVTMRHRKRDVAGRMGCRARDVLATCLGTALVSPVVCLLMSPSSACIFLFEVVPASTVSCAAGCVSFAVWVALWQGSYRQGCTRDHCCVMSCAPTQTHEVNTAMQVTLVTLVSHS